MVLVLALVLVLVGSILPHHSGLGVGRLGIAGRRVLVASGPQRLWLVLGWVALLRG